MAYILATEEFRLTKRYGGIFWNDEDHCLYGVPERGEVENETQRKIYLLDDGAETEAAFVLKIAGTSLTWNYAVRCAQFFSGEINVLVDKPTIFSNPDTGTEYDGYAQYVLGFNQSGNNTGERALWPNSCQFAFRWEADPGQRAVFFLGEADGLIVRWSDNATDSPGYTGQFIPWRTEGGQAKAMDFDGAVQLPATYLIVANQGGWIVWLDVSEWNDEEIIATHYKSFGAIQARDISDIAIDRYRNIMWVLDNGNRLLKYELEPFGTEASGYHNTPKELTLRPSSKTVSPGGQITLAGELFDMWGQRLQYAGIPYEMISGNARGKFAEGSNWKTKARGSTGSDGRFTATYKASAS